MQGGGECFGLKQLNKVGQSYSLSCLLLNPAYEQTASPSGLQGRKTGELSQKTTTIKQVTQKGWRIHLINLTYF